MLNRQELIVIPQLSFNIISGEEKIMKKNKSNYCLGGASVKNFWSQENLCSKIELRFDAGCDTDVETSFKNVNKPYRIISNVKSDLHDNSIILEKAFIILSLASISNNPCNLSVGYNGTVSMDQKGGFRGGWINCDPRNYYGYGFEGFINPFIFNNLGLGILINYNFQGLECFAGIRNTKNYASAINNYSWTQGFLTPDIPSVCDIGICYKNKNKIPMGLMFVCTQNDTGKISNNPSIAETEIASIILSSNNKSAITTKALNALIQSFKNDKKLLSYTTTGSFELFSGVEYNFALSCANLKGGTNGKGKIMKWSLGCISNCDFFNDKCKTLTYGLNIGTPAYLQEDYNNSLRKDNYETKNHSSIVCEMNCLIEFCGLNIPVYLDLMNHHDNIDGSDTGSVLIMGLRSMNFAGFGCKLNKTKCLSSNIIDFPEGCLHENDN